MSAARTRSILFALIVLCFCIACDDSKPTRPLSVVNHPRWSIDKTIYEVNVRQYTPQGTFKAFQKHLPRLKKLGAGILWIMPVQPIGKENRKGTLGSYYSIRDYTAINPEFGNLRAFKELVDAIHEQGMYVILDWVANHTAWDHPWVNEHPEWYTQDSSGQIISPVKDWSDVADLNYENEAMRNAMLGAMTFWVEDIGVDGFRCDVAEMVPIDFWEEARSKLNAIKPVFMLAEGEAAYLHEKAFDMTYDWRTFYAMNHIAAGQRTARAVDSILTEERRLYPPNAFRMRFTTNHDENSWNGTVFERLGRGAKTFAVLTATLPNSKPLLYSGQEAGLNKRLRFFNKDTIQWRDNTFHTFYRRLFTTFQNNAALYRGDYEHIESENEEAVLIFVRTYQQNKALIVLNLSAQTQKVAVESEHLAEPYEEIFSGIPVRYKEQHTFNLEPWAYRLYITE